MLELLMCAAMACVSDGSAGFCDWKTLFNEGGPSEQAGRTDGFISFFDVWVW